MPNKQRAKPVAAVTKLKGAAVTKKTAVKKADKGNHVLVACKAKVAGSKLTEKGDRNACIAEQTNAIACKANNLENELDEMVTEINAQIFKVTHALREMAYGYSNESEAFSNAQKEAGCATMTYAEIVGKGCGKVDQLVTHLAKVIGTIKKNSRGKGEMYCMSKILASKLV
jgi:hypothetical protein